MNEVNGCEKVSYNRCANGGNEEEKPCLEV